jgi:hypothetical protein
MLQTRRTDYLKKLQQITVPLYVEGVYSIYQNVKKNNKARKFLLKEFQQSMVDVSRWSQDIIRNEHQRFKKASTVIDKLIKAIFDLDITLKQNLCVNANDFIPQPWDFIHQCYLNVARSLWKQPFLIYDVNVDKFTMQQNKLKIEKLIASSIQDTFAQFIPLDIEHSDVANDDSCTTRSMQVDDELVTDDAQPSRTSLDICESVVCLGSNPDQLRRASISKNNLESVECVESLEGFDNVDAFQDSEEGEHGEAVGGDVFEMYGNVGVNNDEEGDVDTAEDGEGDVVSEGDIIDVDNEQDYVDDVVSESDIIDVDNEQDYVDDSGDVDEEGDDVASFHSDDVGDAESVKSEELYIQRNDMDEDNEDNQTNHHTVHVPEIKEVFIGSKNEMETYKKEHELMDDSYSLGSPADIKVVTIDENKPVNPKNSLLTIKKKVKSSIYNKERERERFGDKVRSERRSMSFF